MPVDEEKASSADARVTFVVHLFRRCGREWQGELLCAETGETRSFRSSLELLKLMDSALPAATDQ